MLRFVLAAVTITLVACPPALAHAILIDSTPAANSTATGPDVAFTLHYNSRIDKGRSKVTIRKPDSSEDRLPIDSSGPEDVLLTKATLPTGHYDLRWQVLAIDGHITRGDVPFDVKAP